MKLCIGSARGRAALASAASTKNNAQARAWYERSAAARYPNGMAAFGECLLLGDGGPKNTSLGWVYTRTRHSARDVGAYLLGKAFLKGIHNLPKDPVQARFWLMKMRGWRVQVQAAPDRGIGAKVTMWLRT